MELMAVTEETAFLAQETFNAVSTLCACARLVVGPALDMWEGEHYEVSPRFPSQGRTARPVASLGVKPREMQAAPWPAG